MKNELEVLVSEMNSTGILYNEAVREFKKVFISNVLEKNKGNQCKAAKQLGMHRNTLSRIMAELELDVRTLRNPRNSNLIAAATQDGRRPPRSATPSAIEKKATR